eukprot:gb/GEZN01002520.1/.p1 GENE.gb/GEZN01002520.1/~~gb/GEZN01002520.1/.p1  ORF type:complete len:628 (-),score=133.27 gb/GEZN01002520.1/:526-2409(-)
MDIQRRQKDLVLQMLSLQAAQEAKAPMQGVWKVLVYDQYCLDILAPLVNKGELLKAGITLRMSIKEDRQRVEDVPAIYFIRPTEENVGLLIKDLSAGLYDSCFLHFSSSLPRPLLEHLAKESLRLDCAGGIAKVYDQYMEFVCLQSDVISCQHLNSYTTLSSAGDEEMMVYLEQLVSCLFSMLVVSGQVPVIWASPGQAAAMVAQLLSDKLRAHLTASRHNLFSSASGKPVASQQSADGEFTQRPLLILTDRNLDLNACLAHPWTYQALLQDLLDMKGNRVHVEVETESKGKLKQKIYDLDQDTDEFWKENAGLPFPTVLVNFQALKNRVQQEANEVMSLAGPAAEHADLGRAIDSLPEVRRRKDCAEMHLNLSTAIVKALTSRKVDEYFSLELDIINRARVEHKVLKDHIGKLGSAEDKIRLLCIHFLATPDPSKEEVSELLELLAGGEGQEAKQQAEQALAFLKQYKFMHKMASGVKRNNEPMPETQAGSGGLFAKLTSSVLVQSQGLLAGVKNLLPASSDFKLTAIVDSLMNKRDSALTSDFKFFDPKARRGGRPSTVPAQNALVFVLGGGTYNEHQNLADWANRQNKGGNPYPKSIVYGSTEMLTPSAFLHQLIGLGGQNAPR